MKDVIAHYDQLIDENNDPVHDPQPLRDYMDQWDGESFIESMQLNLRKSVLEIGIGTGRIATKIAPLCRCLWGIDFSPKTIQRAAENLSFYQNIRLICHDFLSFDFEERFDVVYSSLTFIHIKDKLFAIQKIASLLNEEGLFVLSIDKNQNQFLDMGTRKIKLYPDDPADIRKWMAESHLELINQWDTEHAHILVSKKSFS